jgi:4-aminobutyrate aminotransferase-like enzyme
VKTEQIKTEAFKRGLLVGIVGTYKQVIRLTPPLIITKEECEIAVNILENSIREVVLE